MLLANSCAQYPGEIMHRKTSPLELFYVCLVEMSLIAFVWRNRMFLRWCGVAASNTHWKFFPRPSTATKFKRWTFVEEKLIELSKGQAKKCMLVSKAKFRHKNSWPQQDFPETMCSQKMWEICGTLLAQENLYSFFFFLCLHRPEGTSVFMLREEGRPCEIMSGIFSFIVIVADPSPLLPTSGIIFFFLLGPFHKSFGPKVVAFDRHGLEQDLVPPKRTALLTFVRAATPGTKTRISLALWCGPKRQSRHLSFRKTSAKNTRWRQMKRGGFFWRGWSLKLFFFPFFGRGWGWATMPLALPLGPPL